MKHSTSACHRDFIKSATIIQSNHCFRLRFRSALYCRSIVYLDKSLFLNDGEQPPLLPDDGQTMVSEFCDCFSENAI